MRKPVSERLGVTEESHGSKYHTTDYLLMKKGETYLPYRDPAASTGIERSNPHQQERDKGTLPASNGMQGDGHDIFSVGFLPKILNLILIRRKIETDLECGAFHKPGLSFKKLI